MISSNDEADIPAGEDRTCGAQIGKMTCEAPGGHSGLHQASLGTGTLIWGIEDAR